MDMNKITFNIGTNILNILNNTLAKEHHPTNNKSFQ